MQVLNAVCIHEGEMFININKLSFCCVVCKVSSNVLPLK